MAHIAYVLSSAVTVPSDTQKALLTKYNIDKWVYEDTLGKQTSLVSLLKTLGPDDTLYVSELWMVAESPSKLYAFLKLLADKDVDFVSVHDRINTGKPSGKMFVEALKSLERIQSGINNERRAAGIKQAKSEGKYTGRTKKYFPDIGYYHRAYGNGEMTKMKISKILDVSRSTLDRMFRDFEASGEEERDMLTAPLQAGSKSGQLRFDDVDMNLKEER